MIVKYAGLLNFSLSLPYLIDLIPKMLNYYYTEINDVKISKFV